MFGIRLGRVFRVHYTTNTIDVLFDKGGAAYGIAVATPFASSGTGAFELPIPKNAIPPGQLAYLFNLGDDQLEATPNLYHLENTTPSNPDLEDPTYNNVYAIIAMVDEVFGRVTPVCLGFVFPDRNQMVFDPENINSSLPQPVQNALRAMGGAFVHRTNSGAYWVVDTNGNSEFFHPNGSFIRIAESPTQNSDGTVHVDLTGANARSLINGKQSNLAWNTGLAKGVDGQVNANRKIYFHMEINTAAGTVMMDIDRETGNLTIQTPVGNPTSTTTNQVSIICGGDAKIESVKGNITVQAANQGVTIEAKTNVTVKTDNATANSILLGPNSEHVDQLALYHALEKKFNNHIHTISNPSFTDLPNQQFNASTDATQVTKAG